MGVEDRILCTNMWYSNITTSMMINALCHIMYTLSFLNQIVNHSSLTLSHTRMWLTSRCTRQLRRTLVSSLLSTSHQHCRHSSSLTNHVVIESATVATAPSTSSTSSPSPSRSQARPTRRAPLTSTSVFVTSYSHALHGFTHVDEHATTIFGAIKG